MGNAQSDTNPHYHPHLGNQSVVAGEQHQYTATGSGVGNNSSSSGGGNSNLYNKMGYHVLQVQPNSPSCGRLVPFFDFIVAANSVIFDKEDSRFADTFRDNIEKEVHLIVYNIKSDTTREQVIVPSNTWGGSGLAGISIRFSSWEKTLENVWHILDVYMSSPAYDAGLQNRTDYIVGTPDMILNHQEDFFTLINNNMYRPIQLYVYSSLTEQVRLITITPNKNWGGAGSLGCDIGYGLLHRIPTKQSVTSQMLTPSLDNSTVQPISNIQMLNSNINTNNHSNISSESIPTLSQLSIQDAPIKHHEPYMDKLEPHQQGQPHTQYRPPSPSPIQNENNVNNAINNNNTNTTTNNINNTPQQQNSFTSPIQAPQPQSPFQPTTPNAVLIQPFEVSPIRLDFNRVQSSPKASPSDQFTQIQF